MSQWCYPTISSSVTPSSSALNLPSIRVSSNKSVLRIRWPKYWSFRFSISPPMKIQDWFPFRLTGLISLLSRGLSRVFSSTTIWKHKFFSAQPSLWSNSHIHTWLQEKSKQTIALTIWTFVSKMMFLLLNMLSMLS